MNLDRLIRKKDRAIIDNNPAQLAAAYKNLGDWYHENQQYENALGCYKEEANIYESLGKRLEKAKAHRMIGEMYMLQENFDNALKYELSYLTTAVDQNNKIEEQRAYATIGRVYLTKAQSQLNAPQKPDDLSKCIKSAEKQFLKSLLICKSLNDLPKHEIFDMTARLYLNLALTYECKEEFNEAIKYFEKAMSICRHNDFWELLHKCYLDAGLMYFNKLNDSTKALQLLNLAINIAERLTTDRVVRICQTLLSKSEVLIKMADFQGAKQILHKAYKLKTPEESDAESIATNLKIVAAMCKAENALITIDSDNQIERKKLYEKLGDGSCKLRNFSAAIGYYKKMLDAAKKNGDNGHQLIPVYVSLYQTYRDMNEYDLALDYMQKEYELCKDVPEEKLSTLLGIAETQSLADKDFWTIDGTYEEARKIAQNMANKKKEKIVLLKQLTLREKHSMATLADIMREELKSSNFNMSDCGDDEDTNDDIDSEELNTPDVGDDICLETLSDSANENEEEEEENDRKSNLTTNQPRTLRKRGYFTVKKNEKGESQLHRACIAGNLTMARRLIDQGHPVNVRDHAGWLPLHEAANHGFTEIVELLLDNGATINDKGGTGCEGFTPLHDACGNGVLNVVELLLNRGANATLKNDKGDTALQTLVKWRKDRILNVQEQSFYEIIYERMYKQLEKAGVSACVDESHTQDQQSTKNHSLLKKPSMTSRNRIVSESTSSEDDNNENGLPESEEFDTIDSIINKELPSTSPEQERERLRESSPTSPCTNYRKVMSDLRKRTFSSDVNVISKSLKPVEKAAKKSAMLAPNEISDDDWLENDLEPSAKRRRYLNDRTFSAESNKSTNCKKEKQKLSGSSLNDSMVVSSTNNGILSDDSDEGNAFNVLMQSNQNVRRTKRRTSTSSNNRFSGESNSMMQSSLLESGFQRHRPVSPDLVFLSSVSSTVTSPHKIINMTPIQSHSVKVQVSDLYLNIPVNLNNANDLTIEWLAEEAAKRYYSLKGLQPVLRLTTKDGAIFENSDPISLAFAENSTISSTVLEWIMPPLAQRYMETCAQIKTNADPFIKSQIELIASTQWLSINDQILSPKYSRPLFKALHYQSNITKIDLTNSFIEDEGMKHLVQALPTMKQIVYLNLSGNLITATGIKHFSSIFDDEISECLPELKTIILNHNPLQNKSLTALEKICCNLNQLTTLHLCSTELTDLQSIDLRFSQLINVDLSFNNFTPTGLLNSVEKLNSCKLEKLKLSFCGCQLNRQEMSERNLVDALTKSLDAGNCSNLEEIHLCGLNLNDVDCWQIVQSLKRSKKLKTLSLRGNSLLTKVTWKLLLENLTVHNLYLEGCKILLNDLNAHDEEALNKFTNCCENIKVSLNEDNTDINQFEIVKRIWSTVTHYAGKVFRQHQTVWLTTAPEKHTIENWEYCHI
ncbi:tonsoku-like protein [Contarinia nasturtii]|uniref:tonsoku-like protein n=1 Tax=Contarinia nasturtii TaxID=265458 RepID=UPI0012D4B967|nr:tonsoku-like protein [Contarinia nasturtii]